MPRPATAIPRIAARIINRFLSQDAAAGAPPTLYAAVQNLPGNSYVGPDGRGEWRGSPILVDRSDTANDPELARRLWTVSEELTGVTFPEHLHVTATQK
nr:hypothetical protein [Frankia sp. Cppng1_Ct_nod]